MTETTPEKTQPKILLLWLIVAAAFALFNAAYWPARTYHQLHAPGNYFNHARQLREEGKKEEALARLREGVDSHHPPGAAPLKLLAGWLEEDGHAAEARRLQVEAGFYTALESVPEKRLPLIRQALRPLAVERSAPLLSRDAAQGVAVCARDLLGAFGPFRDKVNELSLEEMIALFEICGTVSTDGLIGGTGVRCPETLLALSAGGTQARSASHLFYRGRDYANHERGLYCLFIDPDQGYVITTGEFDIWESESEAARMADLLGKMPEGCIGAFAVKDEASVNMTPELEEELLRFGFERQAMAKRSSVLFGFRYSFAAIGVCGAAPGTAIQAWSPEQAGGYSGHPVICGVITPVEENS